MFAGLAGGQHPDHPITATSQGREITEKNLVVAQAVGGHQPVGQTPAGVGDALAPTQNLLVVRQLAELGHMQAIATGPLAPVPRQGDPLLAG